MAYSRFPEEVERCVQRRVRSNSLVLAWEEATHSGAGEVSPGVGWIRVEAGSPSGMGAWAGAVVAGVRAGGPRRTDICVHRAPSENAESPRARRAAPRGSQPPDASDGGSRAAGGTVNAETRVVGGCGDRRVGQGSTGPDAGRCHARPPRNCPRADRHGPGDATSAGAPFRITSGTAPTTCAIDLRVSARQARDDTPAAHPPGLETAQASPSMPCTRGPAPVMSSCTRRRGARCHAPAPRPRRPPTTGRAVRLCCPTPGRPGATPDRCR